MNLWRRRHNDQAAAERYADELADAYQESFSAGQALCWLEVDCPSDRPRFPVTIREAQAAGLFDGWVAAQCEIWDESEDGIRAIEAWLEGAT